MKQKDVALIILIAFISGVVSFFVSGAIFNRIGGREQKAEKVDLITADFPTPDARYFNYNSIDPTQMIQIGDSNNPNPFNSTQ